MATKLDGLKIKLSKNLTMIIINNFDGYEDNLFDVFLRRDMWGSPRYILGEYGDNITEVAKEMFELFMNTDYAFPFLDELIDYEENQEEVFADYYKTVFNNMVG